VARLHLAVNYDQVARRLGIEGPYELKYHLFPRFLARIGVQRKLPSRLWGLGFALLRRLKFLRGTIFDPFRWDRDRQLERALIEEYPALASSLLVDDAIPYAAKVEIAASALEIRGYDAVKERSVEVWRKRVAELRKPDPAQSPRAAE
jgi:indolepyruvate ferredoxin oxidoreductase